MLWEEHTHQRGRAPPLHATLLSVLLMAPSLSCFKKMAPTMGHPGDGWAWLQAWVREESRSPSPPLHQSPRRDETQPCHFHSSVRKEQYVILLIACNNCYWQGREWGDWGGVFLQSTLPFGISGTPQDSGTALFLYSSRYSILPFLLDITEDASPSRSHKCFGVILHTGRHSKQD